MVDTLKQEFKKVVNDYVDQVVRFVDLHEEFAQAYPELQKNLRYYSDNDCPELFENMLDDEVSRVAPQFVAVFNELAETAMKIEQMYIENDSISGADYLKFMDEPDVRAKLETAVLKYTGPKLF